MIEWRNVLVVARWEFARYFKLKGELISIVLWIGISAALWGGQHLIGQLQEEQAGQLLLVGDAGIKLQSTEQLTLEPTELPLSEAIADAQSRELDGVLNIISPTQATLFSQGGLDVADVAPLLNAASLALRLGQAGISPDDYVALNTPVSIDYKRMGTGREKSDLEKSLAVVVLALVLVGVFSGFSYFFVSITSEKQQRVSEQIISTISAQSWTDGKILGLTCLSLKSVLSAAIWGTLAYFVYQKFGGNSGLATLGGGVAPPLVMLLVTFAILGIALWSSFYALVAATISDPNSSSRSAIMLVPILPVVLAFAVLDNTGSWIVLVLSWFPLTSYVFMPLRLVTETVAVWDWALSAALLVGGIMVFRVAAGRVLKVAMLMFGQEPGWRDVWRWARIRRGTS